MVDLKKYRFTIMMTGTRQFVQKMDKHFKKAEAHALVEERVESYQRTKVYELE